MRVLNDNEAQAISKQIIKKHERESDVNAFQDYSKMMEKDD